MAKEVEGSAFMYYLMEIPVDRLVEAGSVVLVSNNLYPKVEWGVFKEHLPRDVFGRLMHKTTMEYVSNSGKYYECALQVVAFT